MLSPSFSDRSLSFFSLSLSFVSPLFSRSFVLFLYFHLRFLLLSSSFPFFLSFLLLSLPIYLFFSLPVFPYPSPYPFPTSTPSPLPLSLLPVLPLSLFPPLSPSLSSPSLFPSLLLIPLPPHPSFSLSPSYPLK